MLSNSNDIFYSRIFPDVNYIQQIGVVHKNIIIFGPQGSSKTETVNTIISHAYQKYGPINVNAVRTRKNLKLLLEHGIDNKFVQILFADDLTLSKIDTKELEDFYNVRHILEEQGRKNGLVVTINSVHDFFAIPKNLRSFFDALVICAPPTNRYDKNFIEGYIGEHNISLLKQIYNSRIDDFTFLGYKVFWIIGRTGVLYTPKLNNQYLTDLKITVISKSVRSLKDIEKKDIKLPIIPKRKKYNSNTFFYGFILTVIFLIVTLTRYIRR